MKENNEEVKEEVIKEEIKNAEVIEETIKEDIKTETTEQKNSGLATAGMVLGIVAASLSVLFFFQFASGVCATLALIFSIIALVKKSGKGQAIAGLVLGIVAIVLIVNRYIAIKRTVNIITTGIGGITNAITDNWNKITDSVSGGVNKIQNTFSDNANKVEESISEGVNKAQEAITEGLDKAKEAINESINSIQETFKADESSPDKITLEKYNRIEEGMTYEQVAELIGSQGNLVSERSFVGVSTKTYNWPASNGIASATIIFNNGKVSAKSQIGL